VNDLPPECAPNEETKHWVEQARRNDKTDACFARLGLRIDNYTADLERLKSELLIDRASDKKIKEALLESSEITRVYREHNTDVLRELAKSVQDAREQAAANHIILLRAVIDNAAVAGRAVNRADRAADSAKNSRDDISAQVEENRGYLQAAEGRVSTLTRATLAGWLAAATIGSALAMHLIGKLFP
jgi:hypothetical protein